MGEHIKKKVGAKKNKSRFIRYLLNDIKALEYMLEHNLIEDDIIRIGAEQEFCLVREDWRPAMNAQSILAQINDAHFTTELAKYNLEINLDPYELKSDCFQKLSQQLNSLLQRAISEADLENTKIVLTGILPTISKNELEFEYMTPLQRYWSLNEMLKELRGNDFKLHIRGVDELSLVHDSVLFEACNTSFQMHLQIKPRDFIASYNWAQAISGPVLGICTNSPLLLGRELWSETRIALFQQSIDTRISSYSLKDQQPRVTFGQAWATGTIAEIFKDDIAQFKTILTKEIEKDSLDELKKGNIPKLQAMNLNNGTVYRWNRPCYGASDGKAHVRIENRYIPSGPTMIDEIANFVFWVGLMIGRPPEFDDMTQVMDFKDAKSNFVKAARNGKDAILTWNNKKISVEKLIIDEFLPIARVGLEKVGIVNDDVEKYLEIIRSRASGNSGSEWMIANYRTLRKKFNRDDALRLLTKATYNNQIENVPVHQWPAVTSDLDLRESSHLVEHIMSTQLFTVKEDDLASLATSLMRWKNIHHVPVENNHGKITGILTWTHVQKFQKGDSQKLEYLVSDIMVRDVITINRDTHIIDAIHTMKKHQIGCLPVANNKDLIGIITIKDVIPFDND